MAEDMFRNIRILIVDGKPGNAKVLHGILSRIGIRSVEVAEDTACALDMLSTSEFSAIFCDEAIRPLDAIAFSIALRRNENVRNPRVPIIMISNGPRRSQVETSRDSGVNDFIVRPVSTETVRRKLEAVLVAPKPFIQTDGFCGPDRRRKRERRVSRSSAGGTARDRRQPRHSRRVSDPGQQPQS